MFGCSGPCLVVVDRVWLWWTMFGCDGPCLVVVDRVWLYFHSSHQLLFSINTQKRQIETLARDSSYQSRSVPSRQRSRLWWDHYWCSPDGLSNYDQWFYNNIIYLLLIFQRQLLIHSEWVSEEHVFIRKLAIPHQVCWYFLLSLSAPFNTHVRTHARTQYVRQCRTLCLPNKNITSLSIP